MPTPLKRLRGEMDGYAGSTHNVQWGDHLCYKVHGKIFAILGRDHDNGGAVSMSIKTTAAAFRAQTKRPGVTQAPYLAKRQWIRVGDAGEIPWTELRDWVRTSYELVVAGLPKGVRESLAPASAGS